MKKKKTGLTPGPWKWSREFGPEDGPKKMHLQPPPHYGTILTITENKINGMFCGTVSDEDAALIAAAPDLLLACEEALTVFGLFFKDAKTDVIPMLQEAVAKARGQS